MSFSDPAVQPGTAGQGGDAPYSQYLSEIPEEHRGLVEPAFKRWDADVTRRFQESAAYRDQWRPYEELGVNNYDPEQLRGLFEFAQQAQDPDWFKQWLSHQAQQHGILGQPETPETDPSVESLLRQQLSPVEQQLQELAAWKQQQETTAQFDAATQEATQRLSELRAEHRLADGEFEGDLAEMFIAGHWQDGVSPRDAVDKAFADYQRFAAQVEQKFVAGKSGQPTAPVQPGGADPSAAAPQTMKDAAAMAMARLQQQNAT